MRQRERRVGVTNASEVDYVNTRVVYGQHVKGGEPGSKRIDRESSGPGGPREGASDSYNVTQFANSGQERGKAMTLKHVEVTRNVGDRQRPGRVAVDGDDGSKVRNGSSGIEGSYSGCFRRDRRRSHFPKQTDNATAGSAGSPVIVVPVR